MITELVILDVRPGTEAEFEAAFATARPLISAAPGFRGLWLERCLERGSRYSLRVEWERLEDHTEGFRRSASYEQWRALLHGFYDPFPTVEHFAEVALD